MTYDIPIHDRIPGYFDFDRLYTKIVEAAPDGSVLVEVGVWMGKSVIYLAEQARAADKNLTIFAVDTFRGSSDHDEHDQRLLAASYGSVWRSFVYNLGTYGVRDLVVPMCLPSVEAARYFDDGSVYSVFIDAEHKYEAVRADILAWKPKVQPGGWLCGHDNEHPGVKQAVRELLSDVAINDTHSPSWVVRL